MRSVWKDPGGRCVGKSGEPGVGGWEGPKGCGRPGLRLLGWGGGSAPGVEVNDSQAVAMD